MSVAPVPFWDKVDKGDGCWLWLGSFDRLGYGNQWWQGRSQKAHRVAYELVVGPIPKDRELDHLCRNRGCVRPDHLEPVTHIENMRRSPLLPTKGTHCKRGHPLDYAAPDGGQGCRKCRYEAVKRWRARLREEVAA